MVINWSLINIFDTNLIILTLFLKSNVIKKTKNVCYYYFILDLITAVNTIMMITKTSTIQ